MPSILYNFFTKETFPWPYLNKLRSFECVGYTRLSVVALHLKLLLQNDSISKHFFASEELFKEYS